MLQKEEQKKPNVKEGCLNVDSDPYGIFMFAINSPVTKQKYTYRLTKFFDFIGVEGEIMQERCRNVVEIDRQNGSGDNDNTNRS